jgi:hypothetical protein
MDFDRLVFPPAPAILVAGLWYLLLWALCSSQVSVALACSRPSTLCACVNSAFWTTS